MKKKGFTLIELLAVIIVLAIVAIIAIPSILGVIEKSRKSAYKDSVYGIIDAARIYLASNIGNYNDSDEIEFVCNGEDCSNKNNSLSFKGTVPKSGSVYIKGDGTILVESLYNGRYYANNETGEVVITEEDTTMTRGELTELIKKQQKEIDDLKNKTQNLETKNISVYNQLSSIKSTATSIDKVYPVGSIYISVNSVNPSTLYPGTEWEVFGKGRTLLGTDSESEKTGGSNTVKLISSQIPTITSTGSTTATTVTSKSTGDKYTWTYGAEWRTTSTNGAHYHTENSANAGNGGGYGISTTAGAYGNIGTNHITSTAGDHAHNSLDYYINSIDGIKAHTHQVGIPALAATTTYKNNNQSNINIQNPYITVYMWKRVK